MNWYFQDMTVNLRVAQIDPDQEAVHEQVLGAVQVAPFKQLGEHTAERE